MVGTKYVSDLMTQTVKQKGFRKRACECLARGDSWKANSLRFLQQVAIEVFILTYTQGLFKTSPVSTL